MFLVKDRRTVAQLSSTIKGIRNCVGFPVENQISAEKLVNEAEVSLMADFEPIVMAGKEPPVHNIVLGHTAEEKLEAILAAMDLEPNFDSQQSAFTTELLAELLTAIKKCK